MYKNIQYYLIILVANIFLKNNCQICKKQARKYLKTNYFPISFANTSLFYNFDSFSSLKLDCSQKYNISHFIEFSPNKKLILDKTFELTELIDINNSRSLEGLIMSYIKGIDLNLPKIFSNVKTFDFVLIFSKFDIYTNGSLIGASQCNINTYTDSFNDMSSFSSVYFRQVIYPKSICPLFFGQPK